MALEEQIIEMYCIEPIYDLGEMVIDRGPREIIEITFSKGNKVYEIIADDGRIHAFMSGLIKKHFILNDPQEIVKWRLTKKNGIM